MTINEIIPNGNGLHTVIGAYPHRRMEALETMLSASHAHKGHWMLATIVENVWRGSAYQSKDEAMAHYARQSAGLRPADWPIWLIHPAV